MFFPQISASCCSIWPTAMCYNSRTAKKTQMLLRRDNVVPPAPSTTVWPLVAMELGSVLHPPGRSNAPNPSGRSKPTSLSKGTDNNVFIPHCVMGELQLLFAQVAPHQAPCPGNPWKNGVGFAGYMHWHPSGRCHPLCEHLGSWVPQMQRLGDTSVGFCALKPPTQCLPGGGNPRRPHFSCTRRFDNFAEVLIFVKNKQCGWHGETDQ